MPADKSPNTSPDTSPDTSDASYTDRLLRISEKRWKMWLDVQAPYRWNLRRLALGRTLDVGCGIGRNLAHLDPSSVGVDHNASSVAVCRDRGLGAFLSDEFLANPDLARVEGFDSMLAAHLVEHMTLGEAETLIGSYLGFVRKGGSVVLITPQESGFRSDATHVHFVDFAGGGALFQRLGISVVKQYSFPFPRLAGRAFRHNEFVTLGRRT